MTSTRISDSSFTTSPFSVAGSSSVMTQKGHAGGYYLRPLLPGIYHPHLGVALVYAFDLEEHPAAAAFAAQRRFARTGKFEEFEARNGLQDGPRFVEDAVLFAEETRVMIDNLLLERSGEFQGAVLDHLRKHLGIMDDLYARIAVFLLQRVHAVRR